jgi:NAD(P)-dependent dehydrogenase (short-subunit alcohol dehydrogenase family)
LSAASGFDQKAILNIVSVAEVYRLVFENYAYGFAKAAVLKMVKGLALEYEADGIEVNAIQPCQVLNPGLKYQHEAEPKLRQTCFAFWRAFDRQAS